MPKKGYITLGTKVSKEDHDKFAEIAKEDGKSVNQLLSELIRAFLESVK